MAQAATALEVVQAEDTASSNLQIVFASKMKLDELSKSVIDEFRADLLRLAGTQLAETTAANVDTLCTAWTQVQERYKSRSTALATFKTELANTINFFKREHAEELREELQQLVDKCDQELQERSQVDEYIQEQKATLMKWMSELDTGDHPTTAAGGRKTARKRASKKTTKDQHHDV